MKALLIMDKQTKAYDSILQPVISQGVELINTLALPNIPINALIGQAPIIFICASNYYQCKSVLAQCLYSKAQRPTLEVYAFIGDVRQCKNGFIEIETFEDCQTFGDCGIEYSVQRGLDDIYFRTRQLINEDKQCQSLWIQASRNVDKLHLLLDAKLHECSTYDIEIGTQLVPYLKMNVWHSDMNYQKLTGVDKTFCTVHTEERFAYKYQTTLLDKLTAYIQLCFYQSANLPPLHRVYTNGHDFIVRLNQQYDDDYKPTPMYFDTLAEHEEADTEFIRMYVVPKSACGQLHKVSEYYYNPWEDGNNL